MKVEPTRSLVNRFGTPSVGDRMNVESPELVVKQLTAFALIVFELIEVLESKYTNQWGDSPSANLLFESSEVLTELIEDIIVEEFLDTGKILPTPRLNVDASYVEGEELQQMEKLEGIIDKIGYKLPAPQALRASTIREKLHIARLFVLEAVRPSIKEEGDPVNPWAFLEETL